MLNFLGAIPAIYMIDRFGRRPLLLTTFPLMSLALLFTGFCFWIPEDSKARIGLVALGIYVYCCIYSPGEGPGESLIPQTAATNPSLARANPQYPSPTPLKSTHYTSVNLACPSPLQPVGCSTLSSRSPSRHSSRHSNRRARSGGMPHGEFLLKKFLFLESDSPCDAY